MFEVRITEVVCKRCQGTGRVATKGLALAVICSCPAGRMVAAPVIVVKRVRDREVA